MMAKYIRKRGEHSQIVETPTPTVSIKNPSKYQIAVFEAIGKKGHRIIEAVAGSGKTSTIVAALEVVLKINPKARILFLAFNRHIAEELRRRVPESVEVATLNSFGWRVLRQAFPAAVLEERKTDIHLEALVPDRAKRAAWGGSIGRLVGLARHTLRNLENGDLNYLADAYDVEVPVHPDFLPTARAVFDRVTWDNVRFDFDDQIYQPVALDLPFPRYDFVFADEAQDFSPVQIEFIFRLARAGARVFAVGDSRQCHPPGTLIAMTGGAKKPIEDVRPEDLVVTYKDCFRGITTQGRRVLQVASRPYSGRILTVLTHDGENVQVTPNHRIPTRLRPRKGFAVYAMEYGTTSRLGCCQIMYKGGFGPSIRLKHERADSAWVLRVFRNKEDALIYETVTALKFGLPEQVFFEKGKVKARLMEAIGNNRNRLEKCLHAHGREHKYPVCTRPWNAHIGRYIYITQACNLIEGWNVLRTFDGTKDGGSWSPIKSITERREETKVYSLKVEPTEGGRRLYIANNILVHNSIYGFRGADTQAMARMHQALWENDERTEALPLSICYRCPRLLVDEAKQIVPQIEAADGASVGTIRRMREDDVLKDQGPHDGDFVLCRTTAPIVETCLKFIAAGRKATVKGRDIGKSVAALINRVARTTDMPVVEFYQRLRTYVVNEGDKLRAKGRDNQAEILEDKSLTIEALGDGAQTVADLLVKLERIFSDENSTGVTFSTIHRAKGLEAKRIFCLRPELVPFPKVKKSWQVEQEWNLKYVLLTRVKGDGEFVWVVSKN